MQKDSDISIAIAIIGTVVVAIIIFIFSSRTERIWSSGKIPRNFSYNPDNEMVIIISLAGIIIRKDFRDVLLKRKFLSDYFARFFDMEHYNLNETLRDSYQHPTKIEEIAKWFNKHELSDTGKLNVVQLMIDISVLDGELNGHEYDTIKYFHNLIKLPISEFDRMMHIHMLQEERRREQEHQRANTKSTYTHESAKSLACKILGVQINDSEEVIKKAYRKLVKENHPDKFVNGTELQKQMAHDRFLEIQKAYEILEEN